MDELIELLRSVDGFWYLATPYSKHPNGVNAAFCEACRAAAWCIRRLIPVFAPIVHCHPIAVYDGIPLTDHSIWLSADRPMMDAAAGILVCQMPGWNESVGIRHELDVFAAANKPLEYLPWPLP